MQLKKQDKAWTALRSKKNFTAIVSSVMVACLILTAAAQIGMNMYSGAMDSFFGSGETKLVSTDGGKEMDAEYYDYSCSTAEEAKELSAKVNNEVVGEGVTLLKNEDNALPLAEGAKITFLGVNALHYVIGPADDPYNNENAVSLKDGFEAAGYSVNPTVWDYYDRYSEINSSYTFDELMEIDPAQYSTELTDSYKDYSDAAVVVLRRSTGEGTDPSKDMGAAENNRTKLSLSATELELLSHACQNFNKVVVLVMSPNTMELGFLSDGSNYTDPYTGKTYDFGNIKAALWAGGLGLSGAQTLAEILNGTINPSVRLVDTYARDLKADPTYQNVGLYEYTNTTTQEGVGNTEEFYCSTGQAFTVEYEEGIYVGYRYYETAAYEASVGNYEGFDYDKAVIYPFGYGLSYTTFDMEYEGTPFFDEETDEFVFNVKVTNTGKTAGKQVVQIHCNAPYSYDSSVEKAQVVLCGFAKTGGIEPGESEEIEVRADRDYITSYDYKDAKCYILDEGDYNFYLSDNSHSWFDIDEKDASKCYTYQ